MYRLVKISIGICVLGIAGMGCVSNSTESPSRQADIGFGIVAGTKGYQQVQEEMLNTNGLASAVQGQVQHIEGAAYILHSQDSPEIRIPFDENTRIDRPAHVGDWIEAYIDQAGQARLIRNVDDQISLE